MKIDRYSFEEFQELAKSFHGYPAPGLLIGGYMVALGKRLLPADTIFDVIVETRKCLPDAVQLLTLCTVGNGWMKIINLGRYAVTLYDKYNGKGVRVYVDTDKLDNWPELKAWFFKLKPKKEQDTEKLFEEIRQAGDTICGYEKVRVDSRFLAPAKTRGFAVCPLCKEAYPVSDGGICRGCQGEAPYLDVKRITPDVEQPDLRSVEVDEAVGERVLHDMTRIIPGQLKGPFFKAGQKITPGDVCRLQQMGRYKIYPEQQEVSSTEWIHENDAASGFAKAMAGDGVTYSEPAEGKVTFFAGRDGLLCIDVEMLHRFNLVPDVMCAARQNYTVLKKGKPFAGVRAIPLYLSRINYAKGLAVLEEAKVFEVLPLRRARVGVLVTGTEVFQNLIEDKFYPIIQRKVTAYGCEVVGQKIVPDDRKAIASAVKELLQSGSDLIVTTAGLSVDPDDVTRQGLIDAGLDNILYGAPILPGAMTLLGNIGTVQLIGVPACALYYRTTSFDLLLPRLLAGIQITRKDLSLLADGGFCLDCKVCTFPKCPFGK